MRGQWAKSVVRAPHNEVFVLLVRAAAGAAAVTVQHMSRKTAVICRGGAIGHKELCFCFCFCFNGSVPGYCAVLREEEEGQGHVQSFE